MSAGDLPNLSCQIVADGEDAIPAEEQGESEGECEQRQYAEGQGHAARRLAVAVLCVLPRLALEGHEPQTEHVECGHECGDDSEEPQQCE